MSFAWLPRETESLASSALEYARHGWRVFPCAGKEPLIAGGFKSASTDEGQVRAWWKEHPVARIGWAVPEGWFALDVDSKTGGLGSRAELERKHGPLPFTLRQVTGSGGEHWLFRVPEGVTVRQGAGLASGLDTRLGGRGYLVVAPSLHPVAGKPYRWHTVLEPLPMPEWLVNWARAEEPKPVRYEPPKLASKAASERERYARAVLRKLSDEVATCGEGGRNDLLNRAWWRIAQFRDVIGQSEARSELLHAARACGLSEREALTVLR